jgi:hypothetical protein
MSTHTRKSLVDVLNGTSRDELARQFDEAEAAGDMLPLPRGEYRCRLTDGELVTSKGGTPGYQVVFTVDDGEHKGRKLWHTSWLTAAALPMSKRDLAKLGVTSLDMLDRPLPAGVGDWFLERWHPAGGFCAAPDAPLPDLLSTAVTLHALDAHTAPWRDRRETVLDFLDSLWTNVGAFHGSWADDEPDAEYTFYGLVALGHASV